MPRSPRRSYAILWLLLIHLLADVAVGVYRTQDVNRELTDVLSAALGRSQICLLAMWLAMGADPLSWRLCGFAGGAAFIFVLFTRTAIPGEPGAGAVWLQQEWDYYFRLSGPGDLLLKAPVMIGLVAAPLLLLRLGRWLRRLARREQPSGKETREASPPRRRFQFGLGEAILWVVTLSVTFAAVFQTAPYPEWLNELASHWRDQWGFAAASAVYNIASGSAYAAIALASLGVVYGRSRIRLRLPLYVVAILGVGYLSQQRLQTVLETAGDRGLTPVWGLASSEIATSVAAAGVTAASLLLYRLYGPESDIWPESAPRRTKKAGSPALR